MKNQNVTYTTILLTITCLGLLPQMQAVVPPPDGGYPGGNTAEGQAALLSLINGTYNTAVGLFSLRGNTIGNLNTAVGAGTLLINIADQNTATGAGALLSNTSGELNTANGTFALARNTTGNLNNAFGWNSLASNTIGVRNIAIGGATLSANTIGNDNTAVGANSLSMNMQGIQNTAVGVAALLLSTGSNNVALGYTAGISVTTANSVIAIGSAGANVDNSCFIGNIRGITTVNNDAIPVVIDSAGQLGTMSSSRRFKKDINPINEDSEAILALKPVKFHYKSDKTNRPEFGLIAEEVAKVNPDLVVRDANGEIYTVRYDAVNALLLNEFLKERRKVEKQQAAITELKSVVAQQQKDFQAAITEQRKDFEARCKQQDAIIQRVSAQLELNRPRTRTVTNNH